MRTLFVLLILPALAGSVHSQQIISIKWDHGKATGIVLPLKVAGTRDLAVTVSGSETKMIGRLETREDSISFIPVWPFTAGMAYEVKTGDRLVGQFSIPEHAHLVVPQAAIYPSTDSLPGNLLKFYFVFSQPMETGKSYDMITLIDDNGDTLSGTFLELRPELWNADQTRFTLWLDPGRIKRGLTPNEMMGPPLEYGRRFTLIVSSHWKDAEGTAMETPATKAFFVTGGDRRRPDPGTWVLSLPSVGAREPLVIDFKEPLDYSLALDAIGIFQGGHKIDGTSALSDTERRLLFTPSALWKAGSYEVRIQRRLEDLAGNNLDRLFDTDLEQPKPQLLGDRISFELQHQVRGNPDND